MKKLHIIIASVIVFLAFFSTTSAQIITGLQPGSVDPQVTLLQKILNGIGKTITTSGPGSPGQETDTFGALTASAVKAFQCEQGIACSNSGDVANWGVVGPKTRALLNSLGASIINTFSRVTPGSQLGAVSDFDNSLVFYNSFDNESAPGKIGNAKTFNGTSDYIDVPASSGLNNVSNGVSVAAWVNFDAANTGTWQSIAAKLDKAGTNNYPYFQYLLGTNNSGVNNPRFFVTIGSDVVNDVVSNQGIPAGSWHHLVGTYDRSKLRIYVDGVLKGSKDKKASVVFRDSPLRIGAHGTLGEFFKGTMDELRVYNRGLTASEVAELYAFGGGSTQPPISGMCTTTLNQCASGEFIDAPDTCTSQAWTCKGSNGGATVSCSIPVATSPINGFCSTTVNTCTTGTFSDAPDSSTEYKWICSGTPNGCGAVASCTAPIPPTPVTGTCGPAEKTYSATETFPSGAYCSTGSVIATPTNPVAGGSTSWVCKGSNGGADSRTCTATRTTVTQNTYTLTVNKAGTGTGTISGTGLSCNGSTCTASVSSGTSVSLTASPTSGSTFAGWSGGGCSGTGACNVTVSANTSVTATFNPPVVSTYTLTVSKTGTGTGTITSSPTGINCGSTCTKANITAGTAITLTAAPASGSTVAWTGCTVSSSNPNICSVTVNSNVTVAATFNTSGTVVNGTCGPAQKAYSATETFPSGAYCATGTVSPASPANPVGGSSSTWTCNGSTVPLGTNATCTATRSLVTQTIKTLTVSKVGIGSGTVSGVGLTCSGNTCTATSSTSISTTLTAVANSGSTFSGWSGGGCSGTGTCVVNATADTAITATFGVLNTGTGLITPERRIDWSYAGVTGGIPTNRPNCTTAACNTLYGGSVTPATINAAIASAPANSVVRIPAGEFNLNGAINIMRSDVTLRGMGVSTILNFASTNGSKWNYNDNYISVQNPLATDVDGVQPSMGGAVNVANWNGTNGQSGVYSHGATILDLSSTSAINEGDTIVLWQRDPDDSTVPYPGAPIMSLSAPENYIVSAKNIGNGNTNNIATQGSGQTSRAGQQQRVKVVRKISSTQIEISAPGIYRPTGTWKTEFAPQVGLQKTISGVGLENFQFKRMNGGGTVRSLIGFNKAVDSWITGVVVVGTSPSGGKSTDVGINITDSRNVTVRNNWFSDLIGGGIYTTTTYSVSPYQCSGCLIENNIFEKAESPMEVNSGTTGSVIAYNYENRPSGSSLEGGIQAHEEGTAMNLIEGNTVFKFWADTFHGNSTLNTLFRNYFYGDRGIDLMSYHRWYNIIGNVIGSKIVAYKSIYSDSTKYDRWTNNGSGGVAFRLGYATPDTRGSSSNCYNPDFSTENLCADPWVAPSTMIWGNFVAGKSSANGTFDTTEVAAGDQLFPGYANPTTDLSPYPSLYLSSAPSWWTTSKWPAIGPDVTGGALVSGHVAKIPAQNCYEAAGGNLNNFTPNVCTYLTASGGSTGGTGDTTAPTVSVTSPTAGATVNGTITITATASDDVGVAGVQFKVDGANSGAEDTASPYSTTFNTTTLSNGAHTVTAVARDAAGNTTTSGAVSFTVNNTSTTPPSTTFAVGASVQVQGANVNTRSTPSATGAVVGQHNTGDLGTIASTNAGIYADTYYWWYVNFASGASGYVAENYLRPATVGSTSNKFALNERVQVLNANVNARNAAGTTGTAVNGTHQIGDLGNILGGGILADALYWWNVNFDTGADGWVAESYLASYTGGGTGDTTAPTVSVTAPAAGTTVSGTITLSATASDNVGVVAVQFRVDGVNSGVADTSAPYSVTLNTTTLTNGTHTITAVAGDAAGNQTTSSAVTVSVGTGTLSTKFAVGSLVFANGKNVNVRTGPGITGTAIGGQHQTFDLGRVLPTNEGWYSDGFNWWGVDFGTGVDGYVAEPDLTQHSVSSVYALLEASSNSIISGGSSTLTWNSLNATSCTGSGGAFAGAKATSGSQVVSPTSNTTYSIACTNQPYSTTTTQSVTVNVSTVRTNPCTAADGLCKETTCASLASTLSTTAAGYTVRVTPATPDNTACVLPSGVAVNGVKVIGAGSDVAGSVISSGSFTITKNANYISRVSGFRFKGNDVHITMGGSPSARAYVVDNNYFNSNGGSFININANGGVIHHNTFYMPNSTGGGPDVMAIKAGEGWGAATTMGTADTQGLYGGERNIYFEDNVFNNILETAPDGDDGARVVIRKNTYNDSSIVFHSGSPNDTSSDGTRQFEIYNNTFNRVTSNNNVNKWVWVRGGSGVIANNVMASPNTQDYGGKVSIRLGVGCPTGYPVNHQIGQTNTPAQSPPPQPLLIFGNTGVGATESGWLSVGENGTGGGGSTGCANPGNYVKADRDYILNNTGLNWNRTYTPDGTWTGVGSNWVPFTYPHPLVTNPNY